ncbi:MAG: response regulator [Actinomycetota bacterium]|jgi:CheY-like chemotaxis protein|nr:response regulator [Actinomycetota bacterium]
MKAIDVRTPMELLLVEDDPGDVVMTREALEDSKLLIELHVVSNGEEAVAYLRNEAPFGDAARPDLVLLDLNLPRLSGREVLEIVKADPGLLRIPIVILTTSESEEDVLRSYELHANAYVTKPVGFESFVSVVKQIDDFFLSIVRLPGRQRAG